MDHNNQYNLKQEFAKDVFAQIKCTIDDDQQELHQQHGKERCWHLVEKNKTKLYMYTDVSATAMKYLVLPFTKGHLYKYNHNFLTNRVTLLQSKIINWNLHH